MEYAGALLLYVAQSDVALLVARPQLLQSFLGVDTPLPYAIVRSAEIGVDTGEPTMGIGASPQRDRDLELSGRLLELLRCNERVGQS